MGVGVGVGDGVGLLMMMLPPVPGVTISSFLLNTSDAADDLTPVDVPVARTLN